MKNLCTFALCVSLSAVAFTSTAQNSIPINEPDINRPKLFTSLPESIPVNLSQLTSLFGLEAGRAVNLSLSDLVSFQFTGNIVSTVSKYNNSIQSVVVRSTNFPGASLTITKLLDEHGEVAYSGRILSLQHGDLFQLKNISNQLFFVKAKFYDLVNE